MDDRSLRPNTFCLLSFYANAAHTSRGHPNLANTCRMHTYTGCHTSKYTLRPHAVELQSDSISSAMSDSLKMCLLQARAMSIVNLHFFCQQGADTVIYERLDPGNPLNAELRPVTRAHMEGFGAAGLRTLCLASALLDPDFYDECAYNERC